jgi:cation transport ATPase
MASPEQRQALLKAEQDFQAQMAELGYKDSEEMEATAAADRASARNMQVQVRSWIPGALAVSVTIGFFGLLALTATHAPPVSSEKVLDVMTGSLGTAWIMVIGYYFGSSAGSAQKTQLLAQAQPIASK